MRPQSSFLRDSSSVFLRAYLDRDEGISRVVSSYLLDRFFPPRFRRLSRFLRTFTPSLSSRLSRVSGYVDSRLFNDGESYDDEMDTRRSLIPLRRGRYHHRRRRRLTFQSSLFSRVKGTNNEDKRI